MTHPAAIVVGAGPWGLACAWRLAAAGHRVTICDDGQAPAAHVAAGMLGAAAEAQAAERELVAPLQAAAAAWPAFAAQLVAASGRPSPLIASGTLLVAGRPEQRGDLAHRAQQLAAFGLTAPTLSGRDARALEPGLGPAVCAALDLPHEDQVEPRALLGALADACTRAGVTRVAAGVEQLLRDGNGRPCGARTATGQDLHAALVVIAAGWAANRLADSVPLRPVKGQILRLRVPEGTAPPLTRTVRSATVYLVPRGDEVVVGATSEERGDRRVLAAAVADLLNEAIHICPELGELELVECAAGLRPATGDGRPAVGRDRSGLLWAAGGHRNGVLLTPLVADLVADLAAGRRAAGPLAPFTPTRFAPPTEPEVA